MLRGSRASSETIKGPWKKHQRTQAARESRLAASQPPRRSPQLMRGASRRRPLWVHFSQRQSVFRREFALSAVAGGNSIAAAAPLLYQVCVEGQINSGT